MNQAKADRITVGSTDRSSTRNNISGNNPALMMAESLGMEATAVVGVLSDMAVQHTDAADSLSRIANALEMINERQDGSTHSADMSDCAAKALLALVERNAELEADTSRYVNPVERDCLQCKEYADRIADRIAELRAERDRLREAVKGIPELVKEYFEGFNNGCGCCSDGTRIGSTSEPEEMGELRERVEEILKEARDG